MLERDSPVNYLLSFVSVFTPVDKQGRGRQGRSQVL